VIRAISLPPARTFSAFKPPFCFGISPSGRTEEITMIHTGVTAAAPLYSTFDHLPPRRRNPNADDLNRLSASLDHLTLCSCQPLANETDERLLPEAVAMDKQFLVDAMPTAGEQL